jgi:NOL1/NOP2/fmu family ribosome biogenesis protein
MTHPSGTAGGSTLTSSTRWDSSWPELLETSERDRVLGFFTDRFGMDLSVFARYELRKRGSSVWIVRSDPRLPALARLKVRSVGLMLFRQVGRYLKPTSAALQLLGTYAEKNVVRLTPQKLEELVGQGEIRGDFAATTGYVVINFEDLPVGCGLYLPPRLLSRLPPLFRGKNVAGPPRVMHETP